MSCRSPSAPDRNRIARPPAPVTLRLADERDLEAVERVAGRDTAPVPPRPWLVAQRDGVIVVVLSLSSGELVADPFARTAELAEVVRAYAGRLEATPAVAGSEKRSRAGGAIRPRLAGAGGCT